MSSQLRLQVPWVGEATPTVALPEFLTCGTYEYNKMVLGKQSALGVICYAAETGTDMYNLCICLSNKFHMTSSNGFSEFP